MRRCHVRLYAVDHLSLFNLERKSFMPATSARPKETKINLMPCIYLKCSGVEISQHPSFVMYLNLIPFHNSTFPSLI